MNLCSIIPIQDAAASCCVECPVETHENKSWSYSTSQLGSKLAELPVVKDLKNPRFHVPLDDCHSAFSL